MAKKYDPQDPSTWDTNEPKPIEPTPLPSPGKPHYKPPPPPRIRPGPHGPGAGQTGPDPTTDPPPTINTTPTTKILPIPIFQQGPQRTDVFIPENKVPLPIIYGSQRVGAQIWYRKVQPDNTEIVLYAICHGPINSISNILIEGKPIAVFALGVEIYTGTSGQALSTIGSTAEPVIWTSAFPFVAYVVVTFNNPSISHMAPDVTRFTCDVQGMLVRDPRTDPTLVTRYYRDNPALVLADFLSSPYHNDTNGNQYTYGCGIADAQMDFAGTITTAANDCDVMLADAVTKRFTIGLAMIDKKPITDWIEAIRTHGQLLRPIYNNGLFQIVMDKAQASSGVVLTSQGTTANIIACGPLVMKPSSQIPTRVIGNFVNAAAAYKNDSAQDDDPGIATGAVDIIERTYEFGQIPVDQVKRLCKYLRKRAAQDMSGVIRVNAEGLQLLPGLRIPVTADQWNVAGADMIVSDLTSSSDQTMPLAWDVSVEFYAAGVYDDTQATATAYAPPLSPSPFDPATPPDIAAMPYRSIMAAQLQVGTLVPASAAATLGGRILVGPTTRLTADVASGDTTINVAHNNLANNDVVYLETAPGGVAQVEFIKVTSGPSGTGPYSYTVARNQDGSGANAWKQGDCVFNTGQTGVGFIDLYSVRGTKASSEKGPTIVGNIRNSATYNDWEPRWAIGNLNGLYGYATDTYGCAFGVPTAAWVKIDPTNGIRIGFNATTKISLDASGNASFSGSITATSGTIGGWGINSTSLTATNVTISSASGGQISITGGGAINVTGSGSITAGNVTIKGNEIDISVASLTYSAPYLSCSTAFTCGDILCNDVLVTGGHVVKVNGTQVVTSQQAAVADSTDASNAATQLNALLAKLRTHGLIHA